MKLFKNWKFTYFEVHTVLRDEFLRHRKFFHWKLWILSFQTPYRTSSYHSWMSFYSYVYSSSKMSQKPLGMKIPSRSTLLMISYILLKSPQTSTHKKVYVNAHKICGQVFRPFLQVSLRWILKKEQRSWLPHNLKYVGKIGYRTLHPSFFFHFLDAKATLCWPKQKSWHNVDFQTVFKEH